MDAVTKKNMAEKDRGIAELTEPRARIGLIIPSVNRMTEPQFNHYAPDGLGVLVARGRVAGEPAKTVAELTGEIAHAAGTLADAAPDLIVFHCTHTSMKEGADGEARIIDLIRRTTGIEALSTSSLVNDALRALGIKKLVVLSPYMSNDNIIDYLTAAGFTVVKDVALKCKTPRRFRDGDAATLAGTRAGERHARGGRHLPKLHQYHPDRGGRRDRGGARQARGQQQSGGAVGLPQAAQGQARRQPDRRPKISAGS